MSGKKALVTYSRDLQSAPLRIFCEVLDAVRRKIFLPDSTRSGMISWNEDARAERLSGSPMPPDQASEYHGELEGSVDGHGPHDLVHAASLGASVNLLESSSSSSSST